MGALSAFAQTATRDFDNPRSGDTSQQFPGLLGGDNVQRDDTPNDPDYDSAEPDDEDGAPSTTNLFDERFDLFGFPSNLTRLTAAYKDGPNTGKPMISGFNAAGAWKLTRGRPDVVIAILDTGIRWNRQGLRTQVHLNTGELPLPQGADGNTDPDAPLGGYDRNRNGAVDVDDYANDARVTDFAGDGQGMLDGEDLIKAFSNGDDADGNGFVDDIAGWDFFNDDNDPFDQSSYFAAKNHGSARANNAVERGNDGEGEIGVCPQCQFMPIRIWDTFVSDPNTFAMGILYATDNGASVIEGANGSLGHTAFAEAASQYAYDNGLVQTYSGDDLNTANHNYPANYSHTMLIQGVVADVEGLGTDLGQQATDALNGLGDLLGPISLAVGTELPLATYFRGANTTQFGGHSSVSMTGTTGSENTGKASGAAGMVISAARDAGVNLTPDETRIIMEQTAEDILAANTIGVGIPDPAQEGWDSHFGYGRVDLGKAVALAASDDIPPQAALYGPDWYAPLTADSVAITGMAKARFADGERFHWKLEWGTGLAPTTFTTVREADATGTVTDFGSIDLEAVREALDSAVVTPDLGGPTLSVTAANPFQRRFTVRLVVTGDGQAVAGMDRRVFSAFADDTLREGYPRRLGTGGEAPLSYADLDGDNVPELVVPGEDGLLRVFDAEGNDFPGFPVATGTQYQAADHGNAPGFAALAASAPPREILRGAAVADLDDDGIPEIIDTAGIHIYVWQADGTMRDGFPVALDMDNCAAAEQRQPDIHRKCGFLGSPAVGRLKGSDKPPVITAAGLDGHLYAFRADGSALSGYPVNLVDPGQPADAQVLAESVNSPAIGDLDDDGFDDVVIASNESYDAEDPDFGSIAGGPQEALIQVLAEAAGGSSRVYAISGKTGEFLPGWPIHLNGVIQTILPLIGPGHNTALATVGGQKTIAVSTTGGAVGLYGVDGTLLRNMQSSVPGAASNATDKTGQLSLFEYGTFGDIDGTGSVDIAHYGLSLLGAANLLLVGQNFPYNHLIGAYDANTGVALPAYPVVTDDYQFLSSSNIGKVADGLSNQILAGTGLGLVHAYDGLTGLDAAEFPKQTGGWLFAPPELSRDSRLAAITREGYLFEWDVAAAPRCQSEWPSFRHDAHNTGNYDADGTPPGAVRNLTAARSDAGAVSVSWIAPGDDGLCDDSPVTTYRISVNGTPQDDTGPAPQPAGSTQTIALADGASNITVQGVDEAGNVGYPVSVSVGASGGGNDGNGNGDNNSGNDGGSAGSNSPGTDFKRPDGADRFPFGGHAGCTLAGAARFDPLWPLLLVLAGATLALRRRRMRGVPSNAR